MNAPDTPLHPLAGVVITVDGPSASGKGTLAKALARRYRLKFLDTGCLYRAVGWQLMQKGIPATDEAAVIQTAQTLDFDFRHKGNNVFGVWVAGTDVTEAIRTLDVGAMANAIALIPGLRTALRDYQVAFVERYKAELGVILDGRDTGKNICPNANLKILLTADPAVRAERRLKELLESGKSGTLESVTADLARRDGRDDQNMPKTSDVCTIDATGLTADNVQEIAIGLIQSRFGAVPTAPEGE